MEVKTGDRLKSAVSDTEVVVIRASGDEIALTCGGLPLVPAGDSAPTAGDSAPTGEVQAGHEGESLLGKRYVDDGDTIELLCTKPGAGALALDGKPLELKSAKPLPSSD